MQVQVQVQVQVSVLTIDTTARLPEVGDAPVVARSGRPGP
jgi:hypothetical protein